MIEPRQEILKSAYKIWEAHGKPKVREEKFWPIANEEFQQEAEEA